MQRRSHLPFHLTLTDYGREVIIIHFTDKEGKEMNNDNLKTAVSTTAEESDEATEKKSFSPVLSVKNAAAVFSEKLFRKSEAQSQDGTARKIPVIIPVVTIAAVLTAGIVVSSITMGAFKSEKHDAFIATEQSNVNLKSPSGMFLEGISVQGIDLGGKSMKQAQDILCIEESEMIPDINYTLNCHDKIVYVTEDDLDFEFDTVKILNEAYEYSEYMRDILAKEERASLKSDEKKDYSISMTFNENSIGEVSKAVAEKVNVKVQDAHVTEINTEAVKTDEMFSFADGVVGYDIDVDDLTTQIATLIKNENYTAEIIGEMKEVQPEITLENLKQNLVLISQYETWSGNTWAGNMNMMTAMQSMNGSIIKDGEIFSFNEHTGNSNLAENGYYSAGVIVNGRSADGIGGGICQAATTIYNAAIRADMTVVAREPHTWPSVYVPVGIDSAIDYGNIDMSFKNETGHDVYLICYMDGAQLNAFIYGYKPTEYDEIVVSSWFTGSSGVGFGAAACRNYYKDGELKKTEDLPSSFYSNGGGTSYSYDEPLSGYVYKRVFTNQQAADGKTQYEITVKNDDDNEDDSEETNDNAE